MKRIAFVYFPAFGWQYQSAYVTTYRTWGMAYSWIRIISERKHTMYRRFAKGGQYARS